MSNRSIWPIDRTLSDASTSSQSGPGSDCNECVLHIPQRSNITGAPTIRLFVISRTLVRGADIPPQQRCCRYVWVLMVRKIYWITSVYFTEESDEFKVCNCSLPHPSKDSGHTSLRKTGTHQCRVGIVLKSWMFFDLHDQLRFGFFV